LGFDPRALRCLEIIFQNLGQSQLDCMVIKYDDDFKEREPLGTFLKSNIQKLENLIPKEKWNSKLMSVDTVKQLKKSEFMGYSDIIIDISSMPNGVYFPMIKTILDWINSKELLFEKKPINLHVVLSENAQFDGMIMPIGMNDKVTYMYKFGAVLQSEAKKNLSKVWIPVLGENQINQLNKINEEISPKETCPIFPIPSVDPYRTKKLLLEYREFLFDTLDIDTRNFIYSNEQNPFETFRKIYETAKYNYEAFNELKGCHIVVSPLSSKLLCLGALLASYVLLEENCNVGIAYVENQTYDITSTVDFNVVKQNSIPFTIWLTGTVYED